MIRLSRLAVVAAVVLGPVILAVPAGAASSGAAMNVDITGADFHVGSCSTTCPWTVTSNVTVVNIAQTTLEFQTVSVTVFWQDTSDGTSGVTTAVSVVDPGTPALQAGDSLGAGDQTEYDGFSVQFALPSGATDADLAISITSQDGTGSGDAPFLQAGNPLPIGAVGGVGVVALGVAFLGYSRWRAAVRKARRRRVAMVGTTLSTNGGSRPDGASDS